MRKEGSLTLDSLTEAAEDDFVFVSEMRYKDYVIEFFKGTQDGKYYWQAEYDGEDRKLSNFNIWVATRNGLINKKENGTIHLQKLLKHIAAILGQTQLKKK